MNIIAPAFYRKRDTNLAAFTLLDLLAVVAMLALLSFLVVPAFAKSRRTNSAYQCLTNARQLAAGFAMYSSDNHDYFPPNPDDANEIPGYNWVPGQGGGGMPPGNTVGGSNLFKTDSLKDPSRSLVATYIGFKVSVFKCPEDPRFTKYSGPDPAKNGTLVPASRSVSLNGGVGTMDPGWANGRPHSGMPTMPVGGLWLDGDHTHTANHPYATFGKTTDFHTVSPASIFLVTEEDPWSINDGALGVIAAKPMWVDFPAVYHDKGCVISFCDGHAEVHKWVGSTLGLTAYPTDNHLVSATDPDWLWVVSHATAKMY